MGGKVISLVDRLSQDPNNRKSALFELPSGTVLRVTDIMHQRLTFLVPDVQKKDTLVSELLEQVGIEVIVPSSLDLDSTAGTYIDDKGGIYFAVDGLPGYFLKLGVFFDSFNASYLTSLTLFKTQGFGGELDVYQNLIDTLRKKTKPVISHDPSTGAAMTDRLIEWGNALDTLVVDLLKTDRKL